MAKGFGGFPGGNMQQLMRQAQKMQQDMQKIQQETQNMTMSASAGGSMVNVEVNGKYELVSLKIDKSVVNPDDVVEKYGADSLRFYEMFMGPLEASLPWSESGLDGAKRYLDRVYRLFTEEEFKSKFTNENDHKLDYVYNFTVKKVTDDFNNLQFNTAISQLMILTNEFYKAEKIYIPYLEGFVKMLDCITPYIGEELWSLLGHNDVIVYESWPTYDEKALTKNIVNIAISINGKLRDTIEVNVDSNEEDVKNIALSRENIIRHLEGKSIRKIIFVKNKILNIVAN